MPPYYTCGLDDLMQIRYTDLGYYSDTINPRILEWLFVNIISVSRKRPKVYQPLHDSWPHNGQCCWVLSLFNMMILHLCRF